MTRAERGREGFEATVVVIGPEKKQRVMRDRFRENSDWRQGTGGWGSTPDIVIDPQI